LPKRYWHYAGRTPVSRQIPEGSVPAARISKEYGR
jgi:hypothetical protein